MNSAILRPRTAVISGAPGSGKTALLSTLARRGFRVVDEAARAILREPGGMALRADDPLAFAKAMFAREMADLESVADDRRWTIFDRGLADSVGFLRLSGIAVPAEMARWPAQIRYSGPVFLAPAWARIYRGDAERIQDWDQAVASGEAVAAAWRDAGHNPIDLPQIAPEERADFVQSCLTEA